MIGMNVEGMIDGVYLCDRIEQWCTIGYMSVLVMWYIHSLNSLCVVSQTNHVHMIEADIEYE